MPSVQFTSNAGAVAWEAIPTVSSSSPHTLMGWVRMVNGMGRYNNPVLGTFRVSGSLEETLGNIGFGPTANNFPNPPAGRGAFAINVNSWWSERAAVVNYPDSSMWYYIVVQLASGSNNNISLRIFNDTPEVPKFAQVLYNYGSVSNVLRYVGISGTNATLGLGAQFKYLRAFVSGTFTDAECIAQARSRTPVAHSTAVLWDAWPFDALQFTGSINNKVLNVIGTPTLAPDQPFMFINPTTLVTGSNSSQVQIATTGYAPVIIGGR